MPHLFSSVLTGAALALLPAVPAHAAPAPTPPVKAVSPVKAAPVTPPAVKAAPVKAGPQSSFRLTLTYPNNPSKRARTVTLECDPAGGAHPRAAAACDELNRSKGKFDHAWAARVCTQESAPVVAKAEGRWHGAATQFNAQYGNECLMHAHTGTIFAF